MSREFNKAECLFKGDFGAVEPLYAEHHGAPQVLTLALLLIRPVPAVVLLVALPPVGDAVAVPALELVVPGAVRGLCRVF